MHSIEGALRMSDEINAQFGFERVFSKTNGNADTDTKITKFGISFNSDGTTTCLLYTSPSPRDTR